MNFYINKLFRIILIKNIIYLKLIINVFIFDEIKNINELILIFIILL